MTYFEYQDYRTQRAVAFDLLDWPDIVVSEEPMPEPEIPLIEDEE